MFNKAIFLVFIDFFGRKVFLLVLGAVGFILGAINGRILVCFLGLSVFERVGSTHTGSVWGEEGHV